MVIGLPPIVALNMAIYIDSILKKDSPPSGPNFVGDNCENRLRHSLGNFEPVFRGLRVNVWSLEGRLCPLGPFPEDRLGIQTQANSKEDKRNDPTYRRRPSSSFSCPSL